MLFFLFLNFIYTLETSNYIEITDQNKKNYLRSNKTILVKFYSPSCDVCQEIEEPFLEASQYFEDALFGGINCIKESALCTEEKVFGTPVIRLFLSYKKDPIEYIGDFSTDSFIDFIEENTLIQSFRPPQPLKDLNPYTFESFIARPYCNFVKFYHPPCNFIPTLKRIAQAFEADQNVSFGMVNCDKFHEICEKNADAPIILYRNRRRILFNRKSKESIETEKKVIKFINRRCRTERGIDGLLIESAGLIKEANKIAKEFVKSVSKDGKNFNKYVDDAIIKLKDVDGAETYISALERIKRNGVENFQNDLQKMFDVMNKKEGSQKVLDQMKRKYNVMIQFLPKSLIPFKKETPDKEL
ncbi:hypothetical protein M9Y10_046078 [Tritrichomonas musculus]|uniref:protein disulfide-isomerase n=1 Tax=Tritrichomonas musculus TaxID=1915356 RepID=A0ABR2JY40_9EUKA